MRSCGHASPSCATRVHTPHVDQAKINDNRRRNARHSRCALGEREKRISSHTNETMRAERSRPARAFPKRRRRTGLRSTRGWMLVARGEKGRVEKRSGMAGARGARRLGRRNVEIVTQRRRPPARDSPSLDKVNKNVPTRTSRGTCEAITGRARANIFYCIPTSVTSSTSTLLLCPARRVTAAFINAESR